MPFLYALGMIVVACFIAGIACRKLETQRISRPVFIHDLAKWYTCKKYLTAGDAVKVCAFVFLFLLVLYAGPLVMTYFPQANILHYRQQQLGFFPTPAMVNGHWATSISYYILAWPLSFIPLNIASKTLFKHSQLASDLSIAIEAHPALSKLMTEKTPEATIRRFHAEQVAPDYVVLHHWAPIEFSELRSERGRLANAGNLDILQMWEVRHGELHFKLRKAQPFDHASGFTQRADGSLVRNSEDRLHYTYFIRVGDTIKIGGSDNPLDRLATYETIVAAPEPLAYVDDKILNETEARRLFEHHRLRYVNGKRVKGKEIFAYHSEIVKFIEEGIANGTFKRFEET